MARSIQRLRADAVLKLAARQHGVVARHQLLEVGLTARAIEHRLKTRQLHSLWRSVYAVGRPEVDGLGELMAATLACGPDAVISHESAAALWGLLPLAPRPVHVSVLAGFDPSSRAPSSIAVSRCAPKTSRFAA